MAKIGPGELLRLAVPDFSLAPGRLLTFEERQALANLVVSRPATECGLVKLIEPRPGRPVRATDHSRDPQPRLVNDHGIVHERQGLGGHVRYVAAPHGLKRHWHVEGQEHRIEE